MYSLVALLMAALVMSSAALAQTQNPTTQTLEKKKKILGKEFSVRETLGSIPGSSGVTAATQIKFFNRPMQLIQSKLDFALEEGKVQNQTHELYVNGIRIWTGEGSFENGTLSYVGGVAPTQVEIPVFNYGVGPLVLKVDAGMVFEADVNASLGSPLLTPDPAAVLTSDSLVRAALLTHATASGYVEGKVRVLMLQAGLGGSVNVIDGNADVMASVPVMDPLHPILEYDAKLRVLNGRVYGFVDYQSMNQWKRWKEFNLYSFNGFCWSLGGQSCSSLP